MKPIVPSNSDLAIISTGADRKYLRGSIYGTTSHKLLPLLDLSQDTNNKLTKDWINCIDRKFLTYLRRLDKLKMKVVTYEGQLITTLSETYYGTTSLWYVILYVNGFCHPQEIQRGINLFIPNKSDIDSLFGTYQPNKKSNLGKTVVV